MLFNLDFEDDIETKSEDDNKTKVFKNKLVMKEMELKLVAEIKERADQKQKNSKESPQEPLLAVSGISHDPVVQLVTELSQTLHLERDVEKKDEKNLIYSKTNSTKQPENNGVNFVTQLKKLIRQKNYVQPKRKLIQMISQ